MIPPPLRDGCLYIDNSSMELFTTCPRQAYYYIIRKRELNKDKIALDFGTAFHAVLEHLYKTYGTAYRSAAENGAVLQFAASQVLNTPEDDYRTIGYLVEAVQQYLLQYPAEVFSIAQVNTAPAVELPFAMPLGTVDTHSWGKVTIIWTGKIDLIYRTSSGFGFIDHKTTSMMGPQYFHEFEFAHQMYGYTAATEFITGAKVSEFTINALGCRKPSRTGNKFEFVRHSVSIQRDLLDEWHTDTLSLVSDFLAHCERGYFPKATKWCMAKYGACQYRAVCSLSPDQRDLALSTSEYKDVTWSPLKEKQV